MIFQLAVIDGHIEVHQDPKTGDLVVEFENPHRAAANKRFQLRFKPEAVSQLSNALLTTCPIHR